jgi:hypothetical protein
MFEKQQECFTSINEDKDRNWRKTINPATIVAGVELRNWTFPGSHDSKNPNAWGNRLKGYYTTGQIAELFGVSKETIKNWEIYGKLIPTKRDENTKARFYKAEEVDALYSTYKNK